MKMAMPLALLLVLLGCAEHQASLPPAVLVREVEPPPLRYQIKYQNRGLQVVPDFAGIDRNGEFVVVPVIPEERRYGFGGPVGLLDNRSGAGNLVRQRQ
ncbi:MAG: hypothetical protein M0P73_14925 [Syntrophobacterales bacterium]|jgi:hypothetical protein|nr:hypothetical protein [Syntrophobacterales bacterium]